jgi:hypothetical protein
MAAESEVNEISSKLAPPARKSAIVRGKRFADVPDMTPEEHKRRGDGADAMFQEMKRQIAEKIRR